MCGRYALTGDPGELERRLLARFPQGRLVGERYNVAPRQQIPVIAHAPPSTRTPAEARWGLLPAWARTSKDKLQPINARDDKLLSGRMWKAMMAPAHRVLLPADGYYEWVRAEKKSERPAPFFHTVDDGGYFAFAGFVNTTTVDDLDEPIVTAAMITTSANGPAARVHNRMPAILSGPEAEAAWLSPDVTPEEAATLIQPLADERLNIRPASTLVNNVHNQGPELLDPDAAP